MIDPVGNETTWIYDALNRVTREENELGAARTFVYDAVSNLTRRTDRLDRVIEYDYDALQRRTAEHWLAANQQILRTIDYAYDGLSRLTGVEDPDSSYAYTYNVAGQVEAVEHDVVMLGHTARLEQTFDAQGNRLQVQAKLDGVNDFLNQYTYDALNRITRIQQQGTAVPKRFDFTYDAASQFGRETGTGTIPLVECAN